MRLTVSSITLIAASTAALACGSGSRQAAAASVHCDRYASPGPGHAQRLVDGLRPGQTGCLRGGRYVATGRDGYALRVARGGRRKAPITVTSAPGERARLRGIVYVVRGANHFKLRGVDIDGRHPTRPQSSQNSLQLMAAHTVIAHSDITNHGVRSCVIIGDRARHPVLRRNVFHDCGDPANRLLDHAIYVQSSSRARIVDNVFLRSGGWAVQLYPAAHGSRVANNLMWENGGGVIFGGDGGQASSGNVVEHNVIAASRARPEVAGSFGGPLGRRNVARSNCLAPGITAVDVQRGFRAAGNRVSSGPGCLGAAASKLVAGLRGAAPALVSRLNR